MLLARGAGIVVPAELQEVFMSRETAPLNCQRRTFVQLAVGAGLSMAGMPALAQQATDPAEPLEAEFMPKLKRALVISNGDYLAGKGLRPAKKNLVDMTAALQGVGFDVDAHLDLGKGEFKETVAAYARKLKAERIDLARGDSVLVFYFFGHGLELDGINYLVPAQSDPASKEAVEASVKLQQDVLGAFPIGYPGVTLAFIDACRIGFTTDTKDLTQVKPPPGAVIMYGSRAGRPAISPKSETRNSFFTAALTTSLKEYNGSGSIYDLCISAEALCLDTVTDEFTRLGITMSPQQPQTAANLRGSFKLPPARDVPISSIQSSADEEKAWNEIQRIIRPKDLARQCEAFLKAYPVSRFLQPVKARLQGARETLKAKATVRDMSFDALDDKAGDATYREDLVKALRGDKDAALRIADAYRDGRVGLKKSDNRYELWLRFSAALGSGIAAWQLYELALEGKLTGSGAGSTSWRTRAAELGYQPPRELDRIKY